MTNSHAIPETTPYPWPFDGPVVPSRCALIISGAGPTWSGLCPADPESSQNIARLREAAHSKRILVVLIQHRSVPRVATPEPPTADPLTSQEGEIEVHAAGIDGFYGSSLDADLRAAGRTQLIAIGHGFETTVHSTVRRANDRGYECLTVADACICHDASMRKASISTIEMSGGIFGAVGQTHNVLNTLNTISTEEQT